VLPAGHPEAESEIEILTTVEGVCAELTGAEFEVSRLALGRDPEPLIHRLRDHRPDAVFNLFEGLADDGNTEPCVAGLLEWFGVPFTGSPSATLALARNKPLTKMLMYGAGLPTPPFFTVEDRGDRRLANGHVGLVSVIGGRPMHWPVIVKAGVQDASVGIDQGSVVTDPDALKKRIALLLDRFGPPVLVEQYIEGRELTVGVVEAPDLRVLPISEFVFRPSDTSAWRIVTYDAKWRTESRDFAFTPYCDLATVPPEVAARLRDLAARSFRLLGLRDYGRIDFRVTPEGEPFILEANPNPDYNPQAGLSCVLPGVGLTNAQLSVQMVRQAMARVRQPGARPAVTV
jgi:D-alanine-D-alanine ligase